MSERMQVPLTSDAINDVVRMTITAEFLEEANDEQKRIMDINEGLFYR